MTDPHEISRLRAKLPANFTDDFLLTRALTHRSYLNENKDAIEENERLEFLGDAILGFIIAEWLYNKYPEKKEGFLTKIRAALVQARQLADFARKIDLGSALLLGRGEELGGGRNRDAILCDAFEAVVAALYLSTTIETVREFIIPLVEVEAETIVKNHLEEDPKSLLQEWAQSHGFSSPVYQLADEIGPDHAKTFVVKAVLDDKVLSTGSGPSKQHAEKAAAQESLKALGISG
ncbi:MAG: ribonuclease III [Anaerolineaceae bacterium]|nr:ribonuclease III [Anaerolineaceae bacterium]